MTTQWMMMKNNSDSVVADQSTEKPVLILVAAGSSSRMGGVKKEYLPMNGGTVLSSAARIFLETLPFSVVAVTYPATQTEADRALAEQKCRDAMFADSFVKDAANISPADTHNQTQFLFVPGGTTRQESVLHALEAAAKTLHSGGSA
ncbi:MAG: 2-C-methyl-D-erythritol 4-phosphate cytidylyltransferase, partial [Treponema sp.]|nr:2-C-methyl-D-erythritol 4-phosphate cytidylyltransferase [Treponema sp.]